MRKCVGECVATQIFSCAGAINAQANKLTKRTLDRK